MHATGGYTIAGLMEVFSISRATVYRVLDRAGARPGAGTGAPSCETAGEVVMLKEVLADGVRALVISRADEKRAVRLAEPLLHQPLRAGDSLLPGSWSGTCTSGSPRPRWKSSSWKKESGTNWGRLHREHHRVRRRPRPGGRRAASTGW
jgi:hypothetical protein